MKRGIPRLGGIPRPQQAGSRLPQFQPTTVVRTPVVQAAPRRVLVPPRTAPKVRSAPVIPVATRSATRVIARPSPQVIAKPTPAVKAPQTRLAFLPSRPTRASLGLTRKVPVVVPVVAPEAPPVVTLPASPVIVRTPSPVITRTPSPVIVRTPSPVIAPVSIPTSPVRVGNNVVMVPDEVVQVIPQQPVVLPRTPVIFPRRRFRYTDPGNELFNQPPTPLYNESVLLQNPTTGRHKILDVAVNPRPIVTTQSGENVVCDIALNVRDPPLTLVSNRIPRPEGFIRKRRRRARKAPGAILGEDMMPLTPSSVRDYSDTPLSALTRRRFSRRALGEGLTRGRYAEMNTSKYRFPVRNDLETSIEWEPEVVDCGDIDLVNLLSPFQELNLMTFSPDVVPYDVDLIQFS